jgi:superfamily II RNA helicase
MPQAPFSLDSSSLFSFPLDRFQKEAIASLDLGKSVVVCAPTGSGKTVIAEYAIHRALARQKRVFYTTPLKALSNQKFRDFQERFGSPEIAGLITGDMVINGGAPIVVMTTEIFRNMLYETPIGEVGTSLEGVETVILDECHYISDRGRGTVWEESIIYCPPTIQLVALSATIGNPEELTDWINQVRRAGGVNNGGVIDAQVSYCDLVNSNFRPVPLRFFYSQKSGLYPLLNDQQTAINPQLKAKKRSGDRLQRLKRQDCPSVFTVIRQLRDRNLLPAIYVIFSRRGCDQAVESLKDLSLVTPAEAKAIYQYLLDFFLKDSPALQNQLLDACVVDAPDLHGKLIGYFQASPGGTEALLEFLLEKPGLKATLFDYVAQASELVRGYQVEPLSRGIAAHHAGILPIWKEMVEQLFEQGLVKVVFATATLSAGINMPARTTVISALKRRNDDGHSLLTPSEFVQIAGRAGRRGMDEVGYVVTVETPYEGSKEASYLATAAPEPLKSCFTPSYGMVLNLLQKHTLDQAKDLLERSFAEYLAQQKLEPEQQAIAELTTEITQLDLALAGIDDRDIRHYEKLKSRLREEQRLLKTLQQQAESYQRHAIAPLLSDLPPGYLIYLNSKPLKTATNLLALLVAKIPGSGQATDWICLSEDNRWHRIPQTAIANIDTMILPESDWEILSPPDFAALAPVKTQKGDEVSLQLAQQLRRLAQDADPPEEVINQQQKITKIEQEIAQNPLERQKNASRLLKLYHQRQLLRDKCHQSQVRYQKLQTRQSYYWSEFLSLIEVLQSFQALDGYLPTLLGQAAATTRGENELWLALVMLSEKLDDLAPPDLAAAISALITEPLRPDTWSNYGPPEAVLVAFQDRSNQTPPIGEIRRQLIQSQRHHDLSIPIWFELSLMGVIEQWALGVSWYDLCDNTSLDEGDLVRLIRRTIDILWQIPQIRGVSVKLSQNAKEAILAMKRFPI